MADEVESYVIGEGSEARQGTYCDCTAGSGGHAQRILDRADGATLVAIDRDEAALERLTRAVAAVERVDEANAAKKVGSVLEAKQAA